MVQVHTIEAPTHWAPYLVNGDASGMDAADIVAAEAWRRRENVRHVLACQADAERFTWSLRLYAPEYAADGGSVAPYTVELTPDAQRLADAIAAAASDPETTGEFDPVDYQEGGDGKVYPL